MSKIIKNCQNILGDIQILKEQMEKNNNEILNQLMKEKIDEKKMK